jgi:hypothetical protein
LLQKLFLKNKPLNYSKIPDTGKYIVRSYQKFQSHTELLTVKMLISYRYAEVKSVLKSKLFPNDFTIFVGLFNK